MTNEVYDYEDKIIGNNPITSVSSSSSQDESISLSRIGYKLKRKEIKKLHIMIKLIFIW